MSSTYSKPIRTPPRSLSPSLASPPENLDIHRPITSTRRPPPNTPSEPLQPASPVEPAPIYVAHELLSPNPPDISEDTTPPYYQFDSPPVPPVFQAILDDDETELERLLAQDPELVNKKDPEGRTPLYRAVIAYDGRIEIVKLLLEADAEVDAWSTEVILNRHWRTHTEHKAQRTALMAASACNRLPIVHILLSQYNADSTLVAPDGQHALRLASTARAREIVLLLPSLRAGGWKRMKHRSRPHIEVIKKTGKLLYVVGKVIVWHIPKFFLWYVPKELGRCIWRVLKSSGRGMGKGIKLMWGEAKKLPAVVKEFCVWLPGAVLAAIKRSPGVLRAIAAGFWKAVKAFAKWAWDIITVHLPKVTVEILMFLGRVAKWIWNFLTVTFPKFTVDAAKFFWKVVKGLAKWIWKIITVRVPKVSAMVYRTIVGALGTAGQWVVKMLGAIASLLHTFVSFLLRQCTLANVIQGIKQTLNFFFVSIPKAVWSATKGTYSLCFKIVKGLFGCVGEILWAIGECMVFSALWFPAMIGKILLNCAKIITGGLKEIRLWVNPKADV